MLLNEAPFVTDIILYRLSYHRHIALSSVVKLPVSCIRFNTCPPYTPPRGDYQTKRLRRLLVQAAVEHLTRYREFERHELESDDIAVATADCQAMYAYVCEQYALCKELCWKNIRYLARAVTHPRILITPAFFPLLDNDLILLRGLLCLILESVSKIDKFCRITSLAMSVYLLVKCLLKISPDSPPLTVLRIVLLLNGDSHEVNNVADRLTLSFCYRRMIRKFK